jgi:hypothetical protein
LVFGARRVPPRRAGARNTFKEPAGGLWGILNESQNLQRLSDFLQRLSNFPQRLSKILNSFSLS